jgi:hypothetical protein
LSFKTKFDSLSVVWSQNHWYGFSQFDLKIGGFRFPSLVQNRQLWFGDLGIKITVAVSWFWPQNQVDDGLSVAL